MLEEFQTAEVGVLVTARLKELGEGSGKADGNYHDGVVLCLAEYLTIEFVAVRQFAGIKGTLEKGISLCVLEVADTIIRNKATRVLHTIALQSYRDIGMSVIIIEDIHDSGILLTLTVYDDTFQVHESFIDIMMKHHQGEEVVRRTTEVRVQNHLDGLNFFLLLTILLLLLAIMLLAISMLSLHAHEGKQAQND